MHNWSVLVPTSNGTCICQRWHPLQLQTMESQGMQLSKYQYLNIYSIIKSYESFHNVRYIVRYKSTTFSRFTDERDLKVKEVPCDMVAWVCPHICHSLYELIWFRSVLGVDCAWWAVCGSGCMPLAVPESDVLKWILVKTPKPHCGDTP